MARWRRHKADMQRGGQGLAARRAHAAMHAMQAAFMGLATYMNF
jgi:hypothetical protein